MAETKKWFVASNSKGVWRAIIGETVRGVLHAALPRGTPISDRSSNVTLVFESGWGLTINKEHGTYWTENPTDIAHAIETERQRLVECERDIRDVLSLAGAARPEAKEET